MKALELIKDGSFENRIEDRSFESCIRDRSSSLSPSQSRLLESILNSKEETAVMSVREIAERNEVSAATVSRFARQLGFSSFSEFQDVLRKDMLRRIDTVDKMRHTAVIETASGFVGNAVKRDAGTMEEEAAELSEQLILDAAEKICKASCVYVAGLGSARSLAEFLCYRFSWMGIRNRKLTTGGSEFMERLVFLGKRDLLISIGFRKTYPEIEIAIDHAVEKEAGIIGMAESPTSYISRKSEILIPVRRGPQGEWNSLAYPMSVCNILVRQVLEKRKDKAIRTAGELEKLNKRLGRRPDAQG